MFGESISSGISKVSFEIPNKIYLPYIERRAFHKEVKV